MIRNFCHLSTIFLVLTILITPAIPMFNFAQDSIKIGQIETDAEERCAINGCGISPTKYSGSVYYFI
jgi:uncharacterized protein CbrC (UPF0167 family)